jgi:hypothetical protein
MSARYKRLFAATVAGAFGGLVASVVHEQFQLLLARSSARAARWLNHETDGTHHPPTAERYAQFAGDRPNLTATARAAEKLSAKLGDDRLSPAQRALGGELVHYGTGVGAGALYGLVAELRPASTTAGGAAMGTALWLLLDEWLAPRLKLSKPASQYGWQTHLLSWVTHLVYGVTADTVRRGTLKLIG